MTRLKKGLSLLAVAAFLITALVPVSGLAAGSSGASAVWPSPEGAVTAASDASCVSMDYLSDPAAPATVQAYLKSHIVRIYVPAGLDSLTLAVPYDGTSGFDLASAAGAVPYWSSDLDHITGGSYQNSPASTVSGGVAGSYNNADRRMEWVIPNAGVTNLTGVTTPAYVRVQATITDASGTSLQTALFQIIPVQATITAAISPSAIAQQETATVNARWSWVATDPALGVPEAVEGPWSPDGSGSGAYVSYQLQLNQNTISNEVNGWSAAPATSATETHAGTPSFSVVPGTAVAPGTYKLRIVVRPVDASGSPNSTWCGIASGYGTGANRLSVSNEVDLAVAGSYRLTADPSEMAVLWDSANAALRFNLTASFNMPDLASTVIPNPGTGLRVASSSGTPGTAALTWTGPSAWTNGSAAGTISYSPGVLPGTYGYSLETTATTTPACAPGAVTVKVSQLQAEGTDATTGAATVGEGTASPRLAAEWSDGLPQYFYTTSPQAIRTTSTGTVSYLWTIGTGSSAREVTTTTPELQAGSFTDILDAATTGVAVKCQPRWTTTQNPGAGTYDMGAGVTFTVSTGAVALRTWANVTVGESGPETSGRYVELDADDLDGQVLIQTIWDGTLRPLSALTTAATQWTVDGQPIAADAGTPGIAGDSASEKAKNIDGAPLLRLDPDELEAGTHTYRVTVPATPSNGFAEPLTASCVIRVNAVPEGATINGELQTAAGADGSSPSSPAARSVVTGDPLPTLGVKWWNDIVPADAEYQWSGPDGEIEGATGDTYPSAGETVVLGEKGTYAYSCVVTSATALSAPVTKYFSVTVEDPELDGLQATSDGSTQSATPGPATVYAYDPTSVSAVWKTSPASDAGWTYRFAFAPADDTARNNKAPEVRQTGSNGAQFNASPENTGLWTVTCAATNPALPGQTLSAEGKLQISVRPASPTIAMASPITYGQEQVFGTAGTSQAFSVACRDGVDAAGTPVKGTVFWTVGGSVQAPTGTSWTWNIPADAEPGDVYAVTAYLMPAGTASPTAAQLASGSLGSVAWTVRIMDPDASIRGVVLEPYTGTAAGATATVAAGGYLSMSVQLSDDNDPDAFTYAWQVCRDGTGSWEDLSTLAGASGRTYTTPNATPAMDGWTYQVVVRSRVNGTPATSAIQTLKVTAPITVPRATIAATSPRMTTSATQHSVIVPEGRSVTMNASVAISGGEEYTVRWQKAEPLAAGQTEYKWEDIPGATGLTYVLEDASPDDQGDMYRCVPTAAYSEGAGDPSLPVQISLATGEGWISIESFTSTPAHSATPPYQVLVGSNQDVAMTVEAEADDGSALAYRWWMNANNSGGEHVIEGATESSYTAAGLQAGSYTFRCEVSSAGGGRALDSVSTNDLIVEVLPEATLPRITQEPPRYAEVRPGSTMNASMSVAAEVTSGDRLAYQWQVQQVGSDNQTTGRWEPLTGQTEATLALTGITTRYNGNLYRCQVTNPATGQSVFSHTCQLRVYPPSAYPQILVPDQQSFITTAPVAPGDGFSVSFVAPADGDFSSFAYQWQYSARQTGPFEDIDSAMLPAGAYAITPSFNAQRGFVGAMTLPAVFTSEGSADGERHAPATTAGGEDTPAPGASLPTGYYRLRVQNTLQEDGTAYADPRPTNYSNDALVRVIAGHVPYIETQPAGVTVAQGDPAEFVVRAAVNPSGDGLAYRWQTWQYVERASTIPDGTDTLPNPAPAGASGYWRDCVSTDGSGFDAAAFTTAETTIQQRVDSYNGRPAYFRCVVYDALHGESVTSEPAKLAIIAPESDVPAAEPVIKVAEGVEGVEVSEDEALGKILSGTGLTVTKDGTPASAVLANDNHIRRPSFQLGGKFLQGQ